MVTVVGGGAHNLVGRGDEILLMLIDPIQQRKRIRIAEYLPYLSAAFDELVPLDRQFGRSLLQRLLGGVRRQHRLKGVHRLHIGIHARRQQRRPSGRADIVEGVAQRPQGGQGYAGNQNETNTNNSNCEYNFMDDCKL